MWRDPRTPVWSGVVKGAIVRIYDMEAYEESKRLYPDDPDEIHPYKTENTKPAFAKQKPAARWNWIHKDISKGIARNGTSTPLHRTGTRNP